MTDYPIVRFVAGPGLTAARLDLNDAAPFTVAHENFSFGAPSLEADPLSVGAPYGWRTLTIAPTITGDATLAAPALSALAVELLRASNWLMFQFDADSDPVWIQTYKSTPPALEFADVAVDQPDATWRIPFEVTADAFIRGQRIDLPTMTITNNPTQTRGISAALPPVVGDTISPLVLDIQSDQDMVVQTWLAATSAVDDRCTYDFETPVAYTTADFTVPSGAPISELLAAADALGGQSRRADGLSTALTTVLENPIGADIPVGNYRVFARLKQTSVGDDSGKVGIRVGGRYDILGGLTGHAWQSERRIEPQQYFGWHDLGNLYLPPGAQPEDPDLRGSRKFGVGVRKVSGDNPNVFFGGFVLLPIAESAAVVDSRILQANMGAGLIPVGQALEVNGLHKRLERTVRDLPLPNARASGGFPHVRPGYVNYLHITGDLHTLGALTSKDLNRTYTVDGYYFPQYLHPVVRA